MGQAVVVALVIARGEGLPAASKADTPTEYVVPQTSSESVVRVSVTVVAWAPPTHTRYSATPTLSDAGRHATERLVADRAVTFRSTGIEGSSTSGQAVVRTHAVARADRLPEASTASTEYS